VGPTGRGSGNSACRTGGTSRTSRTAVPAQAATPCPGLELDAGKKQVDDNGVADVTKAARRDRQRETWFNAETSKLE